MAPEQAQGQPVDARTDLFSLGSVLYEMATGRRAFGGDDIPLIVMKIINGIVVPPRAINEAVPRKARSHHPEADGGRSAAALSDRGRAADRHRCRDGAAGAPVRNPEPRSMRHDRRQMSGVDGARGVGCWPLPLSSWLPASSASWVSRRTSALTDRDSIVIGAFENTTADPVFDETLLTALKVHLGQSPFLDIIPDQRIARRCSSMDASSGRTARLTPSPARSASGSASRRCSKVRSRRSAATTW